MNKNEVIDYIRNNILSHFPNNDKIAVAGGAICDMLLGMKPKDFDVFVQDDETEAALIAFLNTNGQLIEDTEKLSDFMYNGHLIQVVKGRHYDMRTPDLMDSFDFIVCCSQVTMNGCAFHGKYFEDLFSREININQITFLANTVKRLKRYEEKGFVVTERALLALTEAKDKIKDDIATFYTTKREVSKQNSVESSTEDIFF